jgi:predicted RNA-binding protein associated with RNAse of E/G family
MHQIRSLKLFWPSDRIISSGRDLEARVDLFHPGDTIVQRGLHRDGRIHSADSVRVVSDDDRGVLTWLARGSQVIRRANLMGGSVRELPLDEQLRVSKIHVLSSSTGRDALWLTPQESSYAISWGFVDGEFDGWYINLQAPARRWWGGIDIHDQALDVLVAADRTWQWKDEDEFAERTGHPLFWDEADAATIRGEAERLIALAETGQFPFDGTWCSFQPDPVWEPTELPWWWDQLPPGEPPAWQQANYLA